jgi:hypothetical protein
LVQLEKKFHKNQNGGKNETEKIGTVRSIARFVAGQEKVGVLCGWQ